MYRQSVLQSFQIWIVFVLGMAQTQTWQHHTRQDKAKQRHTVLHSATQHNTKQNNTIQYHTMQDKTTQHNTRQNTQHNTTSIQFFEKSTLGCKVQIWQMQQLNIKSTKMVYIIAGLSGPTVNFSCTKLKWMCQNNIPISPTSTTISGHTSQTGSYNKEQCNTPPK